RAVRPYSAADDLAYHNTVADRHQGAYPERERDVGGEPAELAERVADLGVAQRLESVAHLREPRIERQPVAHRRHVLGEALEFVVAEARAPVLERQTFVPDRRRLSAGGLSALVLRVILEDRQGGDRRRLIRLERGLFVHRDAASGSGCPSD